MGRLTAREGLGRAVDVGDPPDAAVAAVAGGRRDGVRREGEALTTVVRTPTVSGAQNDPGPRDLRRKGCPPWTDGEFHGVRTSARMGVRPN